MSIEMIMSLVNQGLFPVACVIGLAIFFNKTNENYRNDIKELTQAHKNETESLTKALSELNLSMQRLIDKIDRKED